MIEDDHSGDNYLSYLKNNYSTWSLESETKLVKFIKNFSAEILEKCNDVTSSITSAIQETEMAHVELGNVLNGFSILSDSNFIENRVSQEDDQILKEPSNPPQMDNSLYQRTCTDQQIETALRLAGEVADKCFVKLDLSTVCLKEDSDSDSEQEMCHGTVDVYTTRPLPYILGSDEFDNDYFVGVGQYDDKISISSSNLPPLNVHHSNQSGSLSLSLDSLIEDLLNDNVGNHAKQLITVTTNHPISGLFALSDSDDIFAEESSGDESQKIPSKTGHFKSIFEDSENDDIFSLEPEDFTVDMQHEQIKGREDLGDLVNRSLFSNSQSDEDSFISKTRTIRRTTSKEDALNRQMVNEMGQRFRNKETTSSDLQTTSKLIDLKPKKTRDHKQSSKSESMAKKTTLFSDDEDSNDLFFKSRTDSIHVLEDKELTGVSVEEDKVPSMSDSQVLDTLSKNMSLEKLNISKNLLESSKLSLHSSNVGKLQRTRTLFDSSDNDDDFFVSKKPTTSEKVPESMLQKTDENKVIAKSPTRTKALFDISENEKVFVKTEDRTLPPNTESVAKIDILKPGNKMLFDSSDDDFLSEITGNQRIHVNKSASPASVVQIKSQKINQSLNYDTDPQCDETHPTGINPLLPTSAENMDASTKSFIMKQAEPNEHSHSPKQKSSKIEEKSILDCEEQKSSKIEEKSILDFEEQENTDIEVKSILDFEEQENSNIEVKSILVSEDQNNSNKENGVFEKMKAMNAQFKLPDMTASKLFQKQSAIHSVQKTSNLSIPTVTTTSVDNKQVECPQDSAHVFTRPIGPRGRKLPSNLDYLSEDDQNIKSTENFESENNLFGSLNEKQSVQVPQVKSNEHKIVTAEIHQSSENIPHKLKDMNAQIKLPDITGSKLFQKQNVVVSTNSDKPVPSYIPKKIEDSTLEFSKDKELVPQPRRAMGPRGRKLPGNVQSVLSSDRISVSNEEIIPENNSLDNKIDINSKLYVYDGLMHPILGNVEDLINNTNLYEESVPQIVPDASQTSFLLKDIFQPSENTLDREYTEEIDLETDYNVVDDIGLEFGIHFDEDVLQLPPGIDQLTEDDKSVVIGLQMADDDLPDIDSDLHIPPIFADNNREFLGVPFYDILNQFSDIDEFVDMPDIPEFGSDTDSPDGVTSLDLDNFFEANEEF